MRDSYSEFIAGFGIDFDRFLKWGIDNTIFPSDHDIKNNWLKLLHRIDTGEPIYIRGYGRNGQGNDIITQFYSSMSINVILDPTNNLRPSQILQELTHMKKGKDLINYQVAHIFGHTKNVYLFEAPWNICFVPKLYDPLTGHEAKGLFRDAFIKDWLKTIKTKYQPFINEYNNLMYSKGFLQMLDNFIVDPSIETKYTDKQINKFKTDMTSEFAQI